VSLLGDTVAVVADDEHKLADRGGDRSAIDGAAPLLNAISSGQLDSALPPLIEAINARVATLARLRHQAAAERIVLHGRVRVSNSAKPQYLRGLVGEVHELDGDDVVVCLDEPVGRFTSGHIRCSPELLEPIDGT